MEILPPGAVCTETYLVIDTFDTEDEAKNLYDYLRTKFVRFLVAQTTTTQHIAKANFSFVPVQDFSESWSDEKLYRKYKLADEEIAFIDSMIKPMNTNGGE
jgi:site-specific DNA-methyltransferase (adenine-specific)